MASAAAARVTYEPAIATRERSRDLSSIGPRTGAATASGAALGNRYGKIRLRDASTETARNNEPTRERLIIASAKSATACAAPVDERTLAR